MTTTGAMAPGVRTVEARIRTLRSASQLWQNISSHKKDRRPQSDNSPYELTADSSPAGFFVADFIATELDSERAVTSSLQARGLAVISSAGTLVTLLFGLSALAARLGQSKLPAGTAPTLYVAAGFLAAAAAVGIVTNAPRKVDKTDLSTLPLLLEDSNWDRPAKDAQQKIALARLEAARSIRKRNVTRAAFLQWAIGLEIIGIIGIAVAVGILIGNG